MISSMLIVAEEYYTSMLFLFLSVLYFFHRIANVFFLFFFHNILFDFINVIFPLYYHNGRSPIFLFLSILYFFFSSSHLICHLVFSTPFHHRSSLFSFVHSFTLSFLLLLLLFSFVHSFTLSFLLLLLLISFVHSFTLSFLLLLLLFSFVHYLSFILFLERPITSMLRGFSAPVKMKFHQSDEDLALIMVSTA